MIPNGELIPVQSLYIFWAKYDELAVGPQGPTNRLLWIFKKKDDTKQIGVIGWSLKPVIQRPAGAVATVTPQLNTLKKFCLAAAQQRKQS